MAKKGGGVDKDFTGSVGGKTGAASGLAIRLDELDKQIQEAIDSLGEAQSKQYKKNEELLKQAKKLKQEYEDANDILKNSTKELEKINKEYEELEKKGENLNEEEKNRLEILKKQKEQTEKIVEEDEKVLKNAEKKLRLTKEESEELEKLSKKRKKLSDEEKKRLDELKKRKEEVSQYDDDAIDKAKQENEKLEEGNEILKKRKATLQQLDEKYERTIKRQVAQIENQTSITSELTRANSILGENNAVLARIAERASITSSAFAEQVKSIRENTKLSRVERDAQIKSLVTVDGLQKKTSAEVIKQNGLLGAGKITTEEAAQAIKNQYEELEAFIQAMPEATAEQKRLKEQVRENSSLLKEQADAAEKTIKRNKLLNESIGQFKGEGFEQIGQVIEKINAKDFKGLKAIGFAVGAALGVLASKLIPALGQAKKELEAFYEVKEIGLNTDKSVIELERKKNFVTAGGIEQELTRKENQKDLAGVHNRIIHLNGEEYDLAKLTNEQKEELLKYSQQNLAVQRAAVEYDHTQKMNLNKLNALQGKNSEVTRGTYIDSLNGNKEVKDVNLEQQKILQDINTQAKENNLAFRVTSQSALFGQGIGSVKYSGDQLSLMGISAESLAGDMSTIGKLMGKMPTPDLAADMAMIAKRTNMSTEGIAELTEAFELNDGLSEKVALNMVEGMRAMATQAKIPLDNLMQETAAAQKNMLSYGIKTTKQLAKQVAYFQSMGVSSEKMLEAGKSMVMNYQDSIQAEMELSALLGEQVDLSEVRAAYAAGGPDVAQNVGAALQKLGLDPSQMNQFQTEALQKALGGQFDTSELTKMLQGPGGRDVADLTAKSAEAANKKQVQQKANERVQQAIGSAIIQSESVTIQTDLDAAIEKAITMSDIYSNYEIAKLGVQQLEQRGQAIEAELNKQDAALLKIEADLQSVQTQKGMAGSAFDGVAGLVGGMIGNKVFGMLGNMLPKGGILGKVGSFMGASSAVSSVPTTPTTPTTSTPKPTRMRDAKGRFIKGVKPTVPSGGGGGLFSSIGSKIKNVASSAGGVMSKVGQTAKSFMPKMPNIADFFKGPIMKGIGKALGPILSVLQGAIDIYSITSQARADQAAGKKPNTGKVGKDLFTAGASAIARLGLNFIPGFGTALSLADAALGVFGLSPIDWLTKNLVGLIPDSAFTGLGELALGDAKTATAGAGTAGAAMAASTPKPVTPTAVPKVSTPVKPAVTTPTPAKMTAGMSSVAKAGATAKVAAGTAAAGIAGAGIAKAALETKATAEETKVGVKSVIAKIESTKKEQKEKDATVVKELQTLNASTQTMVKLTRVLTTLAAATFENKTDVTLKLDGKQITYAVDKTKLNGKGMSNNTYGFGM